MTTDFSNLTEADLPAVNFNAEPRYGEGGIITVDFDIEDIDVDSRKKVSEVFPQCADDIKDYFVAAIIKHPDDFLILPQQYRYCRVEQKKEEFERPSDDHKNHSEFIAIMNGEEK